jgi:hypothetical protein
MEVLTRLLEEQATYYPLETLGTDEDALQEMLDSMTDEMESEEKKEKMPKPGDAPVSEISEQWALLITCKDEDEQLTLLERFQEEGLQCRVLIS